jgi:RNA-directed DNA polymerase
MSMHADEDSDEVIVPRKRSNKEDFSLAETVEGRASPKGNGGQPAAVRTLSREAASTGLAAVRQAARQSRGLRFTALLHHITIDLLRQSCSALKHDAAPGIDGETWQSYGGKLEEKLKDLHERMRAFELALSPDKTRLIRFGRHAAKQRQMRGEGNPKPSTSLASRTSAHGHANGAPLSLGARRARSE